MRFLTSFSLARCVSENNNAKSFFLLNKRVSEGKLTHGDERENFKLTTYICEARGCSLKITEIECVERKVFVLVGINETCVSVRMSEKSKSGKKRKRGAKKVMKIATQ